MKERTRTTKGKRGGNRRQVGLDAFGNAIPDVPSAQVEGTGKALRVVEVREVRVGRGRPSGEGAGALVPTARRLFGRLLPGRRKEAEAQVGKAEISDRLEYAFHRLHQTFNERERQLEERLHELKHHQRTLLEQRRGRRRWLPLALAAAAVTVGYGLHLLSTMQQSMTEISRNMTEMNDRMTEMNGHMEGMSGDTRVMSQNMQAMNRSMDSLNGSVGQMNRNVGGIAQSTAPMGQAAQTMNPWLGAFRSFMPF